MKKFFFITLSFLFILYSCKKESKPEPQQNLEDQLSDLQLQILDNAPLDTTTKYSDLLFPDGRNISQWALMNDSGFVGAFSRTNKLLTASDKKDLFIGRMGKAGTQLTDDALCSCYPAQPNGLAYVYGSKYISTTYLHPDAVCRQRLYGLDCSGMIYQMAVFSKLNLPEGGTVIYANPSVWTSAFNSSPDFQGLEMKDLSTLSSSQLEAGDIIIVPGNHMGMIYENSSTLGVLNSQGSKKYTCLENSQIGRGPVKRSDIQTWLGQLFPNNDYHILRAVLNGPPGLITSPISSISQTSAISGGNITNEGGAPVTARGVCWSTSQNPTIANNKTVNGTSTGNFTSNITGLTANTTYYARAYATNSVGTAYGNQLSFSTIPVSVQDSCEFSFDLGMEGYDINRCCFYFIWSPVVGRFLGSIFGPTISGIRCNAPGITQNLYFETGGRFKIPKGATVTLTVTYDFLGCSSLAGTGKTVTEIFTCN